MKKNLLKEHILKTESGLHTTIHATMSIRTEYRITQSLSSVSLGYNRNGGSHTRLESESTLNIYTCNEAKILKANFFRSIFVKSKSS